MNRKTEDQLVRLAFGDLSPEEASRLQSESASNPDAARTLAMYRRMKEELRGLAEVPPDQLSKERLREAILKRGLKEKPVAQRSFSWLWMPAAAAALAFGVVMVKGRLGQGSSTGTPILVSDAKNFTDLPELKIDPSIKLPMPDITTKSVEPTPDEEAGKVAAAERSSHRGRSYGDRHRNRTQDTDGLTFIYGDPAILRASGELAKEKMEMTGPMAFDSMNKDKDVAKPNEGMQDSGSVPATMALKSRGGNGKASAARTPVIVIQPETDDQTGARKAKEVEKTSDVLVGG